MMKQHILCLAAGLLALALLVIGLRALDDTVKMPLITKGQETALPVGPDLPQEGYTAEQVQAMIAALPDPVTEAEAGAVAAARAAYQTLPAEQRTAVGNLTVLEQAEKTLEALRQPTDQPLVVLGVGSEVAFTGGAVYGSSRAEEPASLRGKAAAASPIMPKGRLTRSIWFRRMEPGSMAGWMPPPSG